MTEESGIDIQRLMGAFDRLAKAEWRKQPLLGITSSEVRTLLCIKRFSHEGNGAITVSEISKRLLVTMPTVTHMIKQLEQLGHIQRTVDPKDKRFVGISLTENGEQIVQRLNDYLTALFSGMITKIGVEQSESLMLLLDQVCEYLDETHIEMN